MRDLTLDECLEWRDLCQKEIDLRARSKELQEHHRPPITVRRQLREIRRELDTIRAAQREMAMAYWKEAIDESAR